MAPMTPKLTEIVDSLAESRAALLLLVGDLPQSRLDRRPGPEAWSPAEVLDHVYRAERGVARLVVARVPEALAAGLPLDPTPNDSAMHRLDDRRVTDRSTRIVAPGFVEPRGNRPREELLDDLAEVRAAILQGLRPVGLHDLSGIVHPHPVLGPIDLYQWLLFCFHHERRHTEQIREALAEQE